MSAEDYIVSLEGVFDNIEFFEALLEFFAPFEVNLTTWGKIPHKALMRLAPFRARCSWLRRTLFHQAEWDLNLRSLPVLSEELGIERILANLTWGLTKSGIPLALCKHWTDIDIYGSEFIMQSAILGWLEGLVKKEILQSYEIILPE